MSRVLFIIPAAPVTSDYSGAAARHTQNLAGLEAVADEVHVVRVHMNGALALIREREMASPSAQALISGASSWRELQCEPRLNGGVKLATLARTLVDPVGFEYPDAEDTGALLKRVTDEVQPDLVWVEGTELGAAVARSTGKPWVLSHHDLAYRVRAVRHRATNLRDRWFLRVCRRAEERVTRAAACIVTGSRTEAERLKVAGCRRVEIVPVAYDRDASDARTLETSRALRIVHLGSLETTANRLGLESYLRKSHAAVVALCRQQGIEPQLCIIGDASKLKEPLAGLLKRSRAVLMGFASELSQALKPFDVAILPYENDTGYRTKLPLLLKHAQVVVTTRAAVAGSVVDGLERACVILDRLEEFPAAIARLAAEPSTREILGRTAQALFEERFTSDAVRIEYVRLIDSLTANCHRV